ncbi:mammalian cell entry protein [Mycolicibacterium mucogenicum]|uniref:Mammalian cell entry protein n=1 Tax=Mycolicibacterium mucogenicum TaxID=56689 RepID=A0A1A3HCP8_MYCMU|nr:mammalian cell entry protein [Mycolicibacterium mucogenicum]OBJ45449.1 mammalian cell entry protein [Mycolicibacterium mucogenicum]
MAIDVAAAGELTDESTAGHEDVDVPESDELADTADILPGDGVGDDRSRTSARGMLVVSSAVVLGLLVLLGWLGFQGYRAHQGEAERQRFIDTARQGALNLTTMDWQHADVDVRRIMDGATGEFYNDFANRSQPFVDVLKQAKASSVGTVTDVGLESRSGDSAQVLVSVAVKTSNSAAAQQVPRAWRMRIAVMKIGDQMKVSNVEFVP